MSVVQEGPAHLLHRHVLYVIGPGLLVGFHVVYFNDTMFISEAYDLVRHIISEVYNN